METLNGPLITNCDITLDDMNEHMEMCERVSNLPIELSKNYGTNYYSGMNMSPGKTSDDTDFSSVQPVRRSKVISSSISLTAKHLQMSP